MSVQLPTDTLLKLIEKLRRRGGSQDLSEAMTQAIECWLSDPARFEPGADVSGIHGYQWKTLFLPEGTVLKSWSYGENNYARVEGDQIIHNGRAVSPNEFAQSFARSTRNAWRDLSVRRPGDKTYKSAYRLRDELVAASKAPAATPAPTNMALPVAVSPLPAASAPASPVPQAAPPANTPPRDTNSEPGWDLPERRKFRYRLEDVAY
ncbi:hypothetical protein D0T25_19420 [Duganella sp. BJB488]|uniref:hypothetical protein n=1 Tax=unclassified Duganella TaxID=2636909 RepID=UPI000E343371|nr:MULTISPECIES: hypothetical protein [unclassified Duganella]RFP15294.1 hypothetical protein D0T26_20220 [Duganella sp. BJB489]RFP19850.1 hypothetical protein D0T25_19420 [Duganella sp. BJB488]RFP38238.1 hypothetical protein D0T24_01170 [Duganella sp. BJB480]